MSLIKFYLLRGALTAALILWIAGFSLSFFNTREIALLFIPTKFLYSTVCHQNPAKTISYHSHSMFVCTRCTGIYIGAFLASVPAFIFVRKKISLTINILLIMSVPMLLDVIFLTIGLYQYSFYIAFFTGLLFGSTLFIYILASIENSLLNRTK
ncbi:MAG: DUF2085 domain-containing protein [Ignavibacteriaceae bacterium]|nr:DUF2085 domain-containing protein [Ignavibacteriaceae bacterium]